MDKNKAPIGRKYKEIPVRSALPFWAASAVWVIAALLFPMYSIWHILLVAAISAAAAVAVRLVLPKELRRVEVPFASGDPELDSTVSELDRASDALTGTALAIKEKSPVLSAKISSVVSTTDKIREALIASPDDIRSVRRFMNYYLPTAVKLSAKYESIYKSETAGQNVLSAMQSIENAFDMIDAAFKKQYDALFEDDVIDVSADIKVLETMLERDNIK